MEAKTPSKGFVRTLELLDPLLSVRWGNTAQQFIIERKGVIGEEELKYLGRRAQRLLRHMQSPEKKRKYWNIYVGVMEEWVSAKTGKRVIVMVDQLNTDTYNMLCMSDIKRYGGYSRYADEMERLESFRKQDLERQQSNERIALNKEVYDQLNFLWRKREDALLNGETSLTKMLHGDRAYQQQKNKKKEMRELKKRQKQEQEKRIILV